MKASAIEAASPASQAGIKRQGQRAQFYRESFHRAQQAFDAARCLVDEVQEDNERLSEELAKTKDELTAAAEGRREEERARAVSAEITDLRAELLAVRASRDALGKTVGDIEGLVHDMTTEAEFLRIPTVQHAPSATCASRPARTTRTYAPSARGTAANARNTRPASWSASRRPSGDERPRCKRRERCRLLLGSR